MTHIHEIGDGCPFHNDEPHLSEVMTASQLSSYLGIERKTILRWSDRRESTSFPQAVERFGQTDVYCTVEVVAWCERWFSTRRLSGGSFGTWTRPVDQVHDGLSEGPDDLQLPLEGDGAQAGGPPAGGDEGGVPAPPGTKLREGDQPLPDRRAAVGLSVQSLVIADMEARRRVGVEQYGTELYPNNGRDMLRDWYEELLDATTYARGLMAERDSQ